MLCECGCGRLTRQVKKTCNRENIKKGEYPRFIRGHSSRILRPAFKNGQTEQHGYVFLFQPNHPHRLPNNYVKRSRLVMETVLKRYLTPDELVHHKNEIRNDDRPENLELSNRSNHNKVHHTGKKKEAQFFCLRDKRGRFIKVQWGEPI